MSSKWGWLCVVCGGKSLSFRQCEAFVRWYSCQPHVTHREPLHWQLHAASVCVFVHVCVTTYLLSLCLEPSRVFGRETLNTRPIKASHGPAWPRHQPPLPHQVCHKEIAKTMETKHWLTPLLLVYVLLLLFRSIIQKAPLFLHCRELSDEPTLFGSVCAWPFQKHSSHISSSLGPQLLLFVSRTFLNLTSLGFFSTRISTLEMSFANLANFLKVVFSPGVAFPLIPTNSLPLRI